MESPHLDTSLLAIVFSHLPWKEVLRARRVNRQWKQAAAQAVVAEVALREVTEAQNLATTAAALPHVQSFRVNHLDGETDLISFMDGEGVTITRRGAEQRPPPIDLSSIANFRYLQNLQLQHTVLCGSYPFLFQFQHLKSLDLRGNTLLTWDLQLLSAMPCLENLSCTSNFALTGDLRSLRVLKDSLASVNLKDCERVTGLLDELYDFPHLRELNLEETLVAGDVRTIGETDLVALKQLDIGDRVYGGGDFFHVIEHVCACHHVGSIPAQEKKSKAFRAPSLDAPRQIPGPIQRKKPSFSVPSATLLGRVCNSRLSPRLALDQLRSWRLVRYELV